MVNYNSGLEKLHNEGRQKTIASIEATIADIKDFEGDNAVITVKKIMESTGLSRSALYKEHALKVWNPKLWEERYVEKTKIEKKLEGKFSKDLDSLKKQLESALANAEKLEKRNRKLQADLETEKKRREVKEIELDEQKQKNMRLLAECQRLEQIIHARN
ncbi:DUF6262 family protein [Bacillus thuringiensis]|uniref:DUF6262 family protein n=1 Tax=Bacillus thuringiensis TaxID=1428 RepID=UPI0021D664B8|nr:DUF6262 family protein [Bacillus thuringiensis]MCU7667758.1 DUF6262 family protein [Bacillus thuringiensis]